MEATKLFTLILMFRLAFANVGTGDRKHYVVYMGHHTHPSSESVISANHQLLASVIGSYERAKGVAVHHYAKSFRGFSAMLTPDEAQKLAESESVISVFESRMNKIQTTQSWNFLNIDSIPRYDQLPMALESDVIVGVVDNGVWPESKSFSDYGLGPIPTKFKGKCETGEMFTLANCNRKILGARFYSKGIEAENGPLELANLTFFRSPRDENGHGTHTASTIAGALVSNVSFLGEAKGTARGGAPGARLAIYKACWFGNCTDADLLSAIDDAIHDGVDILSLSLGPSPPQPGYFKDAISIGTFHAFQKGITVCASAGNKFLPQTAINVAPWILTIAASTVDRELQSNIRLGNSKIIKGFGLNLLNLESATGLIAGSNAATSRISSVNASFCQTDTLNPNLIKGKVVVCKSKDTDDLKQIQQKGTYIRNTGGTGMILIHPLAKDVVSQFRIQTTVIGQEAAEELQAYMDAEKNPVASIYQTLTVMPVKPAPKMATFSSKGPNFITPDVIKPDITAPGVNILAAWSPVGISDSDALPIDYSMRSGTSMACPHVSAVAAIIKAYHPSWSPAAIKSAIMTTAKVTDNTGNYIRRNSDDSPATPFDYGSGHINPVAAIDPGLIYDFDASDIIDFLCSYGASPAQLKNLTGEISYCNNSSKPSYNFNYPSIGVSNMNGSLSVYRTVTYYGKGPTFYVSELERPSGVNVSVTPSVLRFRNAGEKMSFRLDFTPSKTSNRSFVFGALTWSNGIHRVRSPIALNVLFA